MANNKKENKIEKFTKEAIGKTLNQFNKEIGIADLVEVNKNQDRILNGILSQVNDESTEKTEKSNIITLDNSTDGIVELKEIQGDTNVNVSKIEEMPITHDIGDKEGNVFSLNEITQGAISIGEIQGNTLVNCNKDDEKELVLMKDLSTQGYSNVTLTEGVDGGLVDVALEGNTMVNVCDQKDPVAITKSYTVETGNHVALQGEYDGKCRPVVTGNTLVNLIPKSSMIWDGDAGFKFNYWQSTPDYIKPTNYSTDYTLIINVKQNDLGLDGVKLTGNIPGYLRSINGFNNVRFDIPHGFTGIYAQKFTTDSTGGHTANKISMALNGKDLDGNILINEGKLILSDFMLLEGDYTNKPIPSYFEGLQSSFEDKVVTQEMVDAGEELAENLGKYKVDYVMSKEDGTVGQTKTFYLNSPLLEGDTIEQQGDNVVHVHRYGKVVLNGNQHPILYPLDDNYPDVVGFYFSDGRNTNKCMCDKYTISNNILSGKLDINYEAFSIVPNYFKMTLSKSKLNSVDAQGIKQYLQSNPVTVVYELKTPTYEVISQNDTILTDSYVAGHLDFDTAVPVEKVGFQVFNTNLKYIYSDTQYVIQFEADNNGKIDFLKLAGQGTEIWNKDVIKGINKFTFTSNSYTRMSIEGIGFNASNIVVTEATDQDFGYFEGMKSVGECEDLEVVSCNKNLFDYAKFCEFVDKRHLNPEGYYYHGFRINVKPNTRYVFSREDNSGYGLNNYIVINDLENDYKSDGNFLAWIAHSTSNSLNQSTVSFNTEHRNCIYVNFIVGVDTPEENIASLKAIMSTFQLEEGDTTTDYIPHAHNTQTLTHEPLRAVGDIKDKYVLIDGKWYIERNCGVRAYQEGDIDNYITDKINTVYPLQTQTYEPIDYNPFTVYSDVTHISNNSTIPCNMTIKNTGYNCLLKPSTTYTVSSNLGLNVVTTPSSLTEDCLRFYDTDTSTVTTMKDVTILEGDYTTGKPLPSHFSGIESCFEQEYDEVVGKYKVKIRVQNEDASKENYIEFYIDEPLRGIRDVKDKVYIKNDKVMVERNCGSIVLDGSEDENLNFNSTLDNSIRFDVPYPNISTSRNYTILCNRFKYATDNSMDSILNHTSISLFVIFIDKAKLQTQDVSGFKQWLQQNPTTVVYQLAEPTYEEVDYQEQRLLLDTYNNSTLFYESNIPVSNTSFKPLWEELVYLKNSTKYYIQFNAVGSGEVVINLGGTELTTEIVEGYNCIPITTPSESTNLMTIIGQGITISEVVVSEVVCGGYYKGLQSCFEEHMENGKYRVLLRGIALDGSKVNGIKLYINEPLRGIGNIKDRLCIKNGKLMVERKCGSVTFDGSDDEGWGSYAYGRTNTIVFLLTVESPNVLSLCNRFIHSTNMGEDTEFHYYGTVYFGATSKLAISINKSRLSTQDVVGFKQWLQQNPTTVVYKLAEPVYEEATNEYGLPIVFEGYENGIVYIDSAVTPTTHIKYTSNNQLATTLSEAEEQNVTTQEDINMNVITYMMDIDMMLTDMEMSNDISVMAVRRDSSNENMLDRMSEEDKKVYQDNTVVMLEKMITANVLDKEDIERRINMYYDKNRISKEQYKYLKSLL